MYRFRIYRFLRRFHFFILSINLLIHLFNWLLNTKMKWMISLKSRSIENIRSRLNSTVEITQPLVNFEEMKKYNNFIFNFFVYMYLNYIHFFTKNR